MTSEQDQQRRELIVWLIIVVTVCLVVLVSVTGCVSQGEYDKTLGELRAVKAELVEIRERNAQMVADAAESRACWDRVLEWLETDEAQLRRALLGGLE